MILFLDDWKDKHPGAIIDTQTHNKSFLRYAALLKEMGVKNHAWPLQLLDPTLQGIDPYDPNLPLETIIKIAVESKLNFTYVIRNLIRDPKGTEDHPLHYKASRGTALYWLYFNHIPTMLTVPRQTLKSFSLSALTVWLLNISCTNTTMALLTKDNTLRASTLAVIKDMIGELPPYLRQLQKADIANTEEIAIKSIGNKLIGQLSNSSPKSAMNCLRGNSISGLFWSDETAYTPNIQYSLPAALAATTAAMEVSRQKDEPYGIIYTTTAASKDDRDGRYAYNLAMNSALWSEKFMDCANSEELEYVIRKNSPKGELRVYMVFSHRALGYTDEWLRKTLERTESKGTDAERDFFNQWSSGTNTSPLDKDLSAVIRESQRSDFFNEISSPSGYITRWFVPENDIEYRMSSSKYIMSCDTSDASGSGDDIALIIRDVRNGEIVAAGTYNETNLITFAEWLCQWLIRFESITLIIERRSTGSMIIDYLLLMLPSKDIDPFKRLYNQAVQYADEYPDRYKEICKPMYARQTDIYIKLKKLFGFATSANGATSRSELYSTTLLAAAKTTGTSVHDPKTIDQILSLEIRNGRVDHQLGNGPNSHDDMVIAWLLSYWLISLGKNLQHYGINSREILIDNRVNKEDNNPLAVYERREQDYLRQQVEALVQQLVGEHDEYASMILERKLRLAASKLNETDKETLSMDELIANIKDSKRMNARNRMRYY